MEKKMSSYKIGIMGTGMVGGSMQKYFEGEKKHQLFLYDKFKKIGSIEEVNKADIIFVCVPTPFDEIKGFDLSFVREALRKIEGNKVVVLKSTVVPGTTEILQKKFPKLIILFNPEFLTEATADQDMRYPDRQIVGFTKKQESYQNAGLLMNLLPLAPFSKIVPATEAEMIKYFGNTWFSTKVIFANQMYDLCVEMGVDYETVKECAAADKRIGPSHLEIFHKGYRGYGGKCLDANERLFIFNDHKLKIIKAKDINRKAKFVLGWDGKQFRKDKIVAVSKRLVNNLFLFNLRKGRSLTVTPEHIIIVKDKNGIVKEKMASKVKENDSIPVALSGFSEKPLKATFKFYEGINLSGMNIFVKGVAVDSVGDLKRYLTFHQYKSLKRRRKCSMPLAACLKANIKIDDLKIKTGKTGTWIPASIKISNDFARLLGYYFAEGCVSDNRVFFSFGYRERDLISDLAGILKKLDIKFSKRIGYWLGKKSSLTIKISSKLLSRYFSQWGNNAYNKFVPSFIFHSKQSIKDNFLSGLLRGDGSIFKSNMGNYFNINYATVSKLLAEGVDYLFREKRILPTIKKIKTAKSKQIAWSLEISEQENVRKLLPFFTNRQRAKIRFLNNRIIKSSAYSKDSLVAWIKIKSILPIKNRRLVYSLETIGHRYVSSWGIITHNCLPKDTRALIQSADKKGVDLRLHKIVEALNNELRANDDREKDR